MQRLVITGGAGRLATALRARLSRRDRFLAFLDIKPLQPPARPSARESSAIVDIADLEALTDAFRGAAAVLHLGGFASERSWAEILTTNIDGTRNVLEAAHRAGVPRVLLASSIHAVGYHRSDEAAGECVLAPRPDSFYGVGKVALEALGSLYADRMGLKVLSLRIAAFEERPSSNRSLSLWFSPGDAARAVEAFLVDASPGHHIAWGVSRNTRSPLDLSAGTAFGYDPQDDAEDYASLVPSHPEPWDDLLAGGFLAPERELGMAFHKGVPQDK